MKRNLLYKIGLNTSAQFIGKGISTILGFVTVGVLTRYLGASGYGNFTLVFAYLSFFGIIADFGLQLTIVRELNQKTFKERQIYGTYLWLKLFLVSLSILFPLFALIFFPYSIDFKKAIALGALAVGVGALNGYGTAIFQSKIRLGLVTLVDVVTKIITVGFIILFVFLKYNFYQIISTVLFGNFFGLLLTMLILRKFIRFNFSYNPDLAKKILIWGFPIGLTSFFSLAYFRLDTIMLSIFRTSEDVGIYSLSYKFFENLLILWGFYMAVLYPIMSKYIGEKKEKEFNENVKTSIILAVSTSLIIITVGFLLAPFIVGLLGGKGFYASILPFQILLASVPFFFVDNIFYHIFISFKKTNSILFIMFSSLILNFFLNLFFIPRYGYIGASITTVVTEIFVLIQYLFFIKTKVNLKIA